MSTERSRWLHKACQVLCCNLLLYGLSGAHEPLLAQVVPDATLPSGERSQVSAGPVFQIDGGAVRDRNLFHSFNQFSLAQGQTAFFNNATNITNIIARVTGGQVSRINGLLQANGTANLFLMNPGGILIGPNASLNIGGTFLATTASAIQFGNQGFYSATQPDAPPLLTVNPSALLFNQLANQPIVNQAKLQVPAGKSLALVGGDILLDRGSLFAQGGRVELGGLAGEGVVALDSSSSNLHLSFGAIAPLANVTLINQSEVNVRTGGSIGINAQNFRMANGSILRGGIAAGVGIPGSKAGDIDLSVPGAVTLTEGSFIANSTARLANGNSGNVNITAGSVLLKDGSQVNASTFGNGNGGMVTIRAQGAVTFDGEVPSKPGAPPTRQYSGTFSRVNEDAIGNSGGIDITADSLTVTNGALLTASTLGKGNAGSITIKAHRDVSFSGVSSDQFPSGAYSGVQSKAVGSSGGISISAGNLLLANGAQLDASTFGQGDAGKIAIQVLNDIKLKGDPSGKLRDPGGIYSFIGEKAIGNSSGISLSGRSLSLENGAAFVASTFGKGNAGDINLQIAGGVTLDGKGSPISTGIFSSSTKIAQGNSGGISLSLDTLSVTNGAAIAASALGKGNAASIAIVATGAVTFDGFAFDGFPSGIFSRIGAAASGTSDINVTAQSLSLTNGAQFQASTRGTATAGSIQISTIGGILIAGKSVATNLPEGFSSSSGLFSFTDKNTSGNGGDINVRGESLFLKDDGIISAQSQGQGNAGNIAIRLRNFLLAQDSQILTNSTQSAGGNIGISARFIGLRGNSDLTTSVLSGTGGGGNITLSAQAIVALDDSDILAFSRDGSGGAITLRTPAFFGFRYRPSTVGDPNTLDGNGRVDVNASGRLRAGTITLPEVTLQPNVTPLPTEVIDTNQLIAHSCIARSARQGSFIVIGAGGLPSQPDDLATIPFPTDAATSGEGSSPKASSDKGTPESQWTSTPLPIEGAMTEVDGIYQLTNGAIVLGRSCNEL
ncbi:MAG: filamentous hemagglutinin N-terminal domain-containing protein [Leptolyngbya sp. BL-A-14]